MSAMGILRKQPKPGQPSDWVQPGLITTPSGRPAGPPQGTTQPVPVRLRPITVGGNSDWLSGALHLSPGSMLWRPDGGVSAQPVELAAATMVPPADPGKSWSTMLVDVETPTGRFQLEMDTVLFEMTQELVAEAAPQQDPSDPGWSI